MRWRAFMAVAFALCLCFSTSSVPTPLYPIYEQHWNLPPSGLSYIFTSYMAAVMVALICFGRVSDTLGRYRTILISLAMLLCGLVLSAFAGGIVTLISGRFIIGFGNGLLTTAGVMALADAHPENDKRVAAVATSMAINLGFGFGPLISGAAAQPGIAPLVLPYAVIFVLALVVCVLIFRSRDRLRVPGFVPARLSLRPEITLPAKGRRAKFILACCGGFSNFMVGSIFFSLVPSLLITELPWQGPLMVGLVYVPMALACIVIQLVYREIEPFKGLALGMVSFAICIALLALGLLMDNALIVAGGILITGIGQGYIFMTSVVIAGMMADERRRAANMSTYFLSAYIGASVPIIGVGLLADRITLKPAILIFCVLTLCYVLALGYWAIRSRPRPTYNPAG